MHRANELAEVDHPPDTLDAAIDEFAAEVRRGHDPDIADYARLYASVEADVRRLLPAVLVMERSAREIARAADVGRTVPMRLGDYEIVREVGRGGMGVVYEARQVSLDRRVGLKLLPAGASSRLDLLRRFRNEALAAARLHHTNIVQVYGIGECDGQHFYVMQFVDGRSLSEVRAQKQLAGRGVADTKSEATTAPLDVTTAASPASEPHSVAGFSPDRDWCRFVADLGRQAGEALAYAHEQGVLHRDIKPSNLIVDAQDRVWITDFGLAKVEGLDDLTATGDVPGTVRYMAPERLRGQSDPRGDIFSLGLVLYELLVGRPAYDAVDRAALFRQVMDAAPAAPRRLAPSIPRDLETVVLKCLEHDPAGRYQSAQGLANDCRRFLEDRPIAARRTSPVERLVRWSRRNKAIAGSLAAVAALLVVIAIGSLLTAAHFRGQEARQRELAHRNAEQSETLRRNLYVAEMNVAAQEAEPEGGTSRLQQLLDPWQHSKPDLRGWEWYYLKALCHRDLLTIPAHTGPAYAVAYNPDGDRLASGGNDNMVRVWAAGDGKELLTLVGHTSTVTSVAWSPDGKRLASSARDAEGTIKIWDSSDGKELVSLDGHSASVMAISWSPDGTRLASASDDHSVKIWDPSNGRELRTLLGHDDMVWSLAWDHASMRLASGDFSGVVKVWRAADGELLVSCDRKDGPGAVYGMIWSPDDKRLIVGGDGGTIFVDAANGKKLFDLGWQGSGAGCLAWNPRSNQLAIGGRTGWVTRLFDADTSDAITVFRGHAGGIRGIAWHPDGLRLASAGEDGAIKIWDMTMVRGSGVLGAHFVSVAHVAWSPDSKQVASAGGDGVIKIWSLDHPESPLALGESRPDKWAWWRVAWNREGTRLACAGGNTVQIWDPLRGKRLVEHARKDDETYNRVAWHPDHSYFLTADSQGVVQAWDGRTGEKRFQFTGFPSVIGGLALSPDGEFVVASGWDGNVWLWDLVSRRLVRKIAGLTRFSRAIAWSPDGTQLAGGDDGGRICLWRAADGKLLKTLRGHDGPIYSLCWQPDGHRLASAGTDSSIRLWDPESGKQVLVLDGWTSGQLSWSPDGTKIAFNGPYASTVFVGDAAAGYTLERQAMSSSDSH
jgi:WD40 repeat protein/serine/threonine protein kinase